jgi:hypothetical protein
MNDIPNVVVAEIEFGNAAVQREGEPLESVGFGSKGELAANTGTFIGYRRSSNLATNAPDDWFMITGAARGGDSGGPVFNANGRVVGVLWGTDGSTVVCVQAGRIHALLDLAIPQSYSQKAEVAQRQRRPTPPMPGDGGCGPGGCPPNVAPPILGAPDTGMAEEASDIEGKVHKYLIPFRNEITRREAETRRELQAIRGQLDSMARTPTPPMPAPSTPESPKDEGPKTIPGKIADREAEWLAQHGGPISKRIAANAEENLDSDSAAVRFKGFTQAKVAMLVFFGGVLFVLGLGVMVLHKINNKVIPILKEKAAQTPNTLDDKLVGVLEKLHGKVDAVEEKIKGHMPNMAETKAKAEAALRVATAAALATPAGPAASVAAGIAAAIPAATPPQ